ncbi:MAG: alpha/beta hydrolase family protein [Thermoplasmatota archaeon]
MGSRLASAALVAILVAGCFTSHPGPPPTVTSSAPTAAASAPSNATVPVPQWPHFPNNGSSVKTFAYVPSFDAHRIPITIYRPRIADAHHRVPILLHSHGFGGSRAKADDAFKPYIAAGFGVVSFDERGHGDSRNDSVVEFMNPNYEVKDISKLIDAVATWDWVLMDGPGDLRLGGIGYSYGGAFQTMGAIFDKRFDAIVPEITWNDIVDALAPGGAIKSGWVDAFYGDGNAQGTVKFSNDFHEGFAYATTSNEFPAGQLPGVPDLATPLHASSPAHYPGRLTIPTILIQGMPDTLFPLNHAVANMRLLQQANATWALYTHLGGHILNTASLSPGTFPVDAGLQPPPGGTPCGNATTLGIAWHERYLLGLDVNLGPRVCIALDDESTVVGPTFPLPGTVMKDFPIMGPLPVATPTPVAQAPAGPGVSIPLLTAQEDMVLAGIPHLNGTITVGRADAIVYFSLQVPSRSGLNATVDSQDMPIRVQGPVTAMPFSLDLGGIGLKLKKGETLDFVASTTAPLFAANSERMAGAVTLDQVHLALPMVPAGTPRL